MVSVRLLCLLLLYFFITGRFSMAHPHQDGNKARGLKGVITGEELWDDILAGTAYWNNRFRGRKILERLNTKGASIGTSKFSSAAARCDIEGKGCLNLEDQKNGRVLLSHEEVDLSGFVAFTADYHAPRHHPPKNN